MITYINIGLALLYILLPLILIVYKIQHAEYPRPQSQKFIADPTKPLPQQKGQQYSWQQDDHENSEYQENPNLVKRAEYETNSLQRARKLARNILKLF